MIPAQPILALLASAMALVTAAALSQAARARSTADAATVVFFFVMMAAMLAGALVYWLVPGPDALLEAVWLSGGIMSAGVYPLLRSFGRLAPASSTDTASASPSSRWPDLGFVTLIAGLVLLNEFLMGWAFSVASGATDVRVPTGLVGLLAGVIDSPWFLFSMSAEMALTVLFLWRTIDPALRAVFLFQAALMFLSPPALADHAWRLVSVFGASAAMVALFVVLMEYVYRHREIGTAFSTYLVRLLAVYAVMMAGLFLWVDVGSPVVFAASIVLEMALFFSAIVRIDRFRGPERIAWQLQAPWAFQLLAYLFVAELFMGAVLDEAFRGSGFIGSLPSAAISGGPFAAFSAALSNGFWFLALVTGSAGFLLMMGIEMASLVALKIRETHDSGLKARLGLMIGAYAAFTVYLPSFWSTIPIPSRPDLAAVPVVGWGMGVGSGGALAPSVFLAILLSYAAIGGASLLFGRRALCSVLCSAPLMFQGTLIDSMKSFNRSSPVARKFLGTRFSTTYSVTMALALVSAAGASLISYLDSVGRLAILWAGADPTVFLFNLYFGVLWYVMFVSIPYTGNYNCVTMGWCHWGAFSGALSRIGAFRLKARDREVCRRCTTFDCARACPVGLVDMPAQLRAKGEFRSSKCCGVGDCIGACPYGNLYVSDIRHWIRGRLRARDPARGRLGLPMLSRPLTRPAPPPSTSLLRDPRATVPARTEPT